MIRMEEFVDYCMMKPGVSQEFPFDKKTMVFKLHGKMFALTDLEKWYEGKASINLKNDPEKNTQLRDQYTAIIPGYHMNKKHWNTVNLYEEELDNEFIFQLIDESYEIIKEKLPKKLQNTLS